jgi:hypothetical protein
MKASKRIIIQGLATVALGMVFLAAFLFLLQRLLVIRTVYLPRMSEAAADVHSVVEMLDRAGSIVLVHDSLAEVLSHFRHSGGGASGDNIASFFDVRARPLLLDGLANDDLHRRHFCLYGLEGPIGYEETLLVLKFSPSGLPSDYFFIADSPDDPVLLQR